MNQVVVCNKSWGYEPTGYTVEYIGRPDVLGNPYKMGTALGERARVVAEFRSYLRAQWKLDGPVRKKLESLAERVRDGECIALQCYCAPQACHGDVIKEAIEGINRRIN